MEKETPQQAAERITTSGYGIGKYMGESPRIANFLLGAEWQDKINDEYLEKLLTKFQDDLLVNSYLNHIDDEEYSIDVRKDFDIKDWLNENK